MPPYLRRRFRGWDWITPRAIQHIPWRERERITREAEATIRQHPRFRFVMWLPIALNLFTVSLITFGLLWTRAPLLLGVLMGLAMMAQGAATVGAIVWRHRHFYTALRQILFDAGIRPRICFECGYEVEGYEGKECPACDAPLLRETDYSPERS